MNANYERRVLILTRSQCSIVNKRFCFVRVRRVCSGANIKGVNDKLTEVDADAVGKGELHNLPKVFFTI